MKFLVTGIGGFIGSNLAIELLKRGFYVRGLDNFSTGRRINLKGIEKDIELIEGDIRNYDTVEKAVSGINYVLHQAALPSVPRSISDPVTSNEVNINGTLNVLEASRKAGVKKFVFASSSSVYGDTPELPKHEAILPSPLSPYAVTKLTGEKYARVYSHVYGLNTLSLRYFNVFGPRQDPDSQYSAVIPKFIKAMKNGSPPLVYGDGEQSRDFTYISNVVEANILAALAESGSGTALNCACHDRITINRLITELNEIMNLQVKPQYTEPRPGDILHSFADISLAEKEIGYKPVSMFKEGLTKTVEWFTSV